MAIKRVKLGNQGLEVPIEGLGCMGMTPTGGNDIYGKADESAVIATIHRALELGINWLDTADAYGPLLNERLVAKAIKGNREKFILATKFGFYIDDNDNLDWSVINGRPEYVRKAIERSLKNLGTDYIDLYYLHRADPAVPIEETVGAMGELVKEGKVKYLGLSEVSPDTLRKAHAVHPVSALQTEYSLFEREVETNGVLDTVRELGVGFVAYSPLGRGFITGELKSPDDFPADDFRRYIPRFQGENFYTNLELVKGIQALAAAKGLTPSQLAMAWVFSKGVTAIPGTKRVKYIEENAAAAEVVLSQAEVAQLESFGTAVGDRYDSYSMNHLNV
ncbi:aldo/keto reductase [Chitinophaga sp.]|uniref:aldo/keto reductase n=1 Tax=Chitinophaga sp. TaxID=1869181 RepID=UPI0031E1C6FC